MTRAERALIRFYDRALEPTALTITQFGLLVYLYQASNQERRAVSVATLAAFLGIRRTILGRALRLLEEQGLIKTTIVEGKRPARSVVITREGGAKLHVALPCWNAAQIQIRAALGAEATTQLNSLFNLATAKLVV